MLVFPKKKAQISMEVIIIFFGILLLFSVLFVTYSNRNSEGKELQERQIAIQTLQEFAYTANTVAILGHNSSKTIIVPTTINSNNYSIFMNNNIMYINWNYKTYSIPVITSNVNLTYSQKNTFTITNTAGEIIISWNKKKGRKNEHKDKLYH